MFARIKPICRFQLNKAVERLNVESFPFLIDIHNIFNKTIIANVLENILLVDQKYLEYQQWQYVVTPCNARLQHADMQVFL